VAEEAAISADVMGNDVESLVRRRRRRRCNRLLSERHRLEAARVVIAVAGMEGRSRIGGRRPGSRAGCRGADERRLRVRVSAALPRCWRCSIPAPAASSVVNIDNGFGAAASRVR
jgi:hypothetical protein